MLAFGRRVCERGLSRCWMETYFDNLVAAYKLVDVFAWPPVEEDAG